MPACAGAATARGQAKIAALRARLDAGAAELARGEYVELEASDFGDYLDRLVPPPSKKRR